VLFRSARGVVPEVGARRGRHLPRTSRFERGTLTEESRITLSVNRRRKVELRSSFAWIAAATIVGLVVWGIVAHFSGIDQHWEVADPAWSPDGTRIVFDSSRRGGRPQIYVVNANGRDLFRLTHSKTYDREPDWSPDGKKIVFVSSTTDPNDSLFGDQAEDAELYVISEQGRRRKRLTHNRIEETDPSWSPDGNWIAFEEKSLLPRRPIYLVDSNGRRLRALAAPTRSPNDSPGSPAWSPDGRRLVFSAEFSGLYVMDLKRKLVERLTNPPDGDYDTRPEWSPDGRRIAFERGHIVVHGGGSYFHVLVINAGGKGARLLSDNGSDPAWSPDSTAIVFRRPGDRQSLFVINRDGRSLRRLTDG